MTESIQPVDIAESARRAAEIAAETLTHQENPFERGSPDYLSWHNAYCRWLLKFSAPDGEGGA